MLNNQHLYKHCHLLTNNNAHDQAKIDPHIHHPKRTKVLHEKKLENSKTFDY